MKAALAAPRRGMLAALAIALAGILFARAAFFPGFMSYDSFMQFSQSQSLRFDDWHPPVMSWAWSLLNKVSHGPEGMLHFHLLLLWAALLLWYRAYRNHGLAWLIPAIGLLPWVLNFAGVLWKDVGMAFALLMLAALAAGRMTAPRALAAALLLFYAVNLRYNAVFAAVPVLLLLAARWFPARSLARTGGAALAMLAVALVAGNLFTYRVLDAERTRPVNFMLVDDLSYLSLKEQRSLLPGITLARIQDCALREISQTRLLARSFCLKGAAAAGQPDPLKADLGARWKEAVLRNPGAYLELRMAAFVFLLRSPEAAPFYYWHPGVDENALGIRQQPGAATALLARSVEWTAGTAPFLFKPYWWLCAAVLLLAGSALLRADRTVRTVQALLASAILYILGYFPITPMADLRYVYWSMLATTLAALLLLVDRPALAPRRRARELALAVAALAALVSCLNAQRWFALDIDKVLAASLTGPVSRVGGTPLLQHLAAEEGGFAITGERPQLTLALAPPVAAAGVRYIGVEFACRDSTVRPTLRLLWWGDGQAEPIASQGIFVAAHDGLNLVNVAEAAQWNPGMALTHLRIDLFDFGNCRQVVLRAPAFYR